MPISMGAPHGFRQLARMSEEIAAQERARRAADLDLRRARTEHAAARVEEVGVLLVQPVTVDQDGPGNRRLRHAELAARQPEGVAPGRPAMGRFYFFCGQRTKNPSAQTMSSSNSPGSKEVTVYSSEENLPSRPGLRMPMTCSARGFSTLR
jgi:hypothetical protein